MDITAFRHNWDKYPNKLHKELTCIKQTRWLAPGISCIDSTEFACEMPVRQRNVIYLIEYNEYL